MTRILVVCLSVALFGACGSESEPRAEVPCDPPTPVASSVRLPGRFPAGEWGAVTRLEERAEFVGAEIISTTQIVELYPDIVRTLTERGYVLLGGDNEGFEAEISFTDPRDNYVNLILREGCEDQVRIRVLIERKAEL